MDIFNCLILANNLLRILFYDLLLLIDIFFSFFILFITLRQKKRFYRNVRFLSIPIRALKYWIYKIKINKINTRDDRRKKHTQKNRSHKSKNTHKITHTPRIFCLVVLNCNFL
jgi:hypothetical protein